MGESVVKSYPALERLIERVSAQGDVDDEVVQHEEELEVYEENEADADEIIDVFDEEDDDPVQIAGHACKPHPVALLEPTVEHYERDSSTPSALSAQFSLNAGRKRARHKRQSSRHTKRSSRIAEHDARKAEKPSKKSVAAHRRLSSSFHDHTSFFGPTTNQWRLMVTPDLDRVSSAQRRFATSVSHSKAAMEVATDELDAATRDATTWLRTHPCPDSNLGDQVAGFVNTCAEVAVASRWSLTSPPADTRSVMIHLEALLSVVDRQVQRLDAW